MDKDSLCCDCRFFDNSSAGLDGMDERKGFCRRHAPQPGGAGTGARHPNWPVVTNTDWCGEWKVQWSAVGFAEGR